MNITRNGTLESCPDTECATPWFVILPLLSLVLAAIVVAAAPLLWR
jgi:hypothetical protein